MKRRALGRGLSDLIPGAQDVEAVTGAGELAIDTIRPNPYQPRTEIDQESLGELVQSIRQNGVLQPVVVRQRGDFYELIAGERRWRAAKAAGLSTVPAVVRAAADQDMIRLALVENLQREDVNAIDAARSYERLCLEFGMTQDTVAETVGKSRASVANTMRLLSLPEGVQRDVQEGTLSEGHGRALLPLVGLPELDVMWTRAVSEQPSVRQLEQWVKQTLQPTKQRPARTEDKNPIVADIQARLERALGSPVRVAHSATKGNGKIEVTYHSLEDLERLFLLLTRI